MREPTYDPGEPTLSRDDLAVMKRLDSLSPKQQQALRRRAMLRLRKDHEPDEITYEMIEEAMHALVLEDIEAERGWDYERDE
mgnify:CR=1 FL=1